MNILDKIFGRSVTNDLPAEIDHEGVKIFLRIKKLDGSKDKTWRIRYISVNDQFFPQRPKGMHYYRWKNKHHQYRTRIRANGETLEVATKKMLKKIELLKKGEFKLSDY